MEGVTLVKKNHYAVLTVDLPQSRNALSVPVVEYMNTLVDQVAEDPDLHCLVLTGGGEKSFIAGADIRKLVEMTPEESRYSIEAGHKLFSKLETMDIPVIASVNGYCLGGGLELAMACDIRICSANARFGLPEINIAMIPGWRNIETCPADRGKPREKYAFERKNDHGRGSAGLRTGCGSLR